MLAGAAGFASVAAASLPWAIAAGAAFVVAAVIGGRRMSQPAGRALSAGLTINVLLRWEPSWGFGLSALVTAVIAALIVITGLSRRGRLARRSVRRLAVVLGVAAGVALVGAVVAIAGAYGDLRDGERALERAAAALRQGDIPVAVDELERSDALLTTAADALDRPWARPALAVPVLGAHVAALVDVSRGAGELADQAAGAVSQVNVDSLRVIQGVIDIDAIEVMERPFGDTNAALRRMAAVLATARSDWLVAPMGDRLDQLADEVDVLVRQTDVALAAVRLAPSMLGRDGARTYFVAFTNPAEARGLGGFMGTWAELRADDGRLEVVRTGLTRDLTGAMRAAPPVLAGPADYLTRYGRFGAGAAGQPVTIDFWSNVTMSPDFPSIADVIAQLYPASGGRPIDGAIAIDVPSIARFLELTGPLEVEAPSGMLRLTAANAAQYLLRDQYADIGDDAARDAVLEAITSQLINHLFDGDLPGPHALAATLGPAMAEGRVVIWSRHPEDQPELERLGIAGRLPPPEMDGLAVVSTNAGANKLDAYLRRSIAYDAVVDEGTGEIQATVVVRLANDAPDNLPADAGGNPFGLPPGTNRQYLSIYSPWELTAAELDGEATGMEPERELGWNVFSRYVDIPPGGEVEVRLAFAGEVQPDVPYTLTLRSQPLTYPDVVRVGVRTADGRTLLESHEIRFGVDRLTVARVSANRVHLDEGRLACPPVKRHWPSRVLMVGAGLFAAVFSSFLPAAAQTGEGYPPAAVVNLLDPFGCAPSSITGDIGAVLPGSTVTLQLIPVGSAAVEGQQTVTVTATAGADGHADYTIPVPPNRFGPVIVRASGTNTLNQPFTIENSGTVVDCPARLATTGSSGLGIWLRVGAALVLAGLALVVVTMRRRRPAGRHS